MKHRSVSAAVVGGLLIAIGLIAGLSVPLPATAAETTIKGELVSVQYGVWVPFGNRKATLVVKGADGKTHTVYVGMKTVYIPHRSPVVGDKVTLHVIRNRGVWAATSVEYR